MTPDPQQPRGRCEEEVSYCLTVFSLWENLTIPGDIFFIVIPGEILLLSHGQWTDMQLSNTWDISPQKGVTPLPNNQCC